MTRLVVPGLVVALSACGVSSMDIAAYEKSLDGLAAEVAAYEAESATTTSEATCLETWRRYETAARAHLQQLDGLSDGMDVCARMRSTMGPVQFASMCSSMEVEFERYGGAPCGADAATNHSLAQGHCLRMRSWLTQQRDGLQPMGGRCGR